MRYPKTSIIDFDDYIQIGSMALLEALKNFDHSKNVKWSTYLTNCVSRAMFQEYAQTRFNVRVPVKTSKNSFDVARLLAADISDSEIIKSLGIKRSTLDGIKNVLFNFANKSDPTVISKPDFMLEICGDLLSDSEKNILQLKLSGYTNEEIGDHFQKSREWARQAINKILYKLRKEHVEQKN